MQKKERYQKVLEWFKKNNPAPETELIYNDPWQLLVAVVLSAQCTDKRVNMTTPVLFEVFPDPETTANAEPEDIFPYIKSISYPNNKSKHLVAAARMLVNEFNGIVPDNEKDLQKLPGVGRKTANVIASVLYNRPTIPVDTHVFRVSKRIGLVNNAKTPLQVEEQLMKNTPAYIRGHLHHWLILHGRYTCKARKPLCEQCGITEWCRYYKTVRNK
jgi:endonuclease III